MPQRNLSQISFFAPGRLVLYVQCRSEALQRQFSAWPSFSSCFLYLVNSLCISERFLSYFALPPASGVLPGTLSEAPWGRVGGLFWLCILTHQAIPVQFSSVQSLSHVWFFATPWIAACQASLSITNPRSLLKPMSTELVMPSNHLILCHPLLLLSPIPPSIRAFSNQSTLHMRWPKYWSFSFSISPSNEHPGLISFRMYWLDLLAVQGTLKSLLWHHSSKASIFQHSDFFIVQLSHPYMATEKP